MKHWFISWSSENKIEPCSGTQLELKSETTAFKIRTYISDRDSPPMLDTVHDKEP